MYSLYIVQCIWSDSIRYQEHVLIACVETCALYADTTHYVYLYINRNYV